MDRDRLKSTIQENSNELARLHALVHETLRHRDEGAPQRAMWEAACAEFHARYDSLAFPGGYDGALDRISSGDTFAIEAGLSFLECRPYFFRSGYMYKDVLRKLKHAPLTESQILRLQETLSRLKEWKSTRRDNVLGLEPDKPEG